jgi:hypothetical protein
MGLRYEHGALPRPTLYAAIGPALARFEDVEEGRLAQQRAVTEQLDRIDRLLVSGEGEFERLWEHRPGRWETWAERALAWWTRGAVSGQ